jgi:hypothetical protein
MGCMGWHSLSGYIHHRSNIASDDRHGDLHSPPPPLPFMIGGWWLNSCSSRVTQEGCSIAAFDAWELKSYPRCYMHQGRNIAPDDVCIRTEMLRCMEETYGLYYCLHPPWAEILPPRHGNSSGLKCCPPHGRSIRAEILPPSMG